MASKTSKTGKTTNRPNWMKISDLLIEKGATQEEIDDAINKVDKTGKSTTLINHLNEIALNSLQIKYSVVLPKRKSKYPYLNEYFETKTADLLLQRQQYNDIDNLSIDNLKGKSFENLSKEDEDYLLKYLRNKSRIEELKQIDKKLEEQGIKIINSQTCIKQKRKNDNE